MKAKKLLLTMALCLFAVAVSYASSPHMGTWKLNEAKSKLAPGSPKNSTVVYEASGDSIKVTVDGVDGEGKPAHTEWTGKCDGKDDALTGDPSADMRSYKMVNEHTLEITNKKEGKVVTTGKIVVSADGKSRTITTTSTDAKGKKVKSVGVYDKE